jgi:hypothetical protein
MSKDNEINIQQSERNNIKEKYDELFKRNLENEKIINELKTEGNKTAKLLKDYGLFLLLII